MGHVPAQVVRVELVVPGIYGPDERSRKWLTGSRAEIIDELVNACIRWSGVKLFIHGSHSIEVLSFSDFQPHLMSLHRLWLIRDAQDKLRNREIHHA